MDKNHEWYKGEAGDKPFTMVYLWKEAKDQPKRSRTYVNLDTNKRMKIFEFGA